MSLRPDGATRGDLAEATALIVTGGVLVTMPALAMLDRNAMGWVYLTLAVAAGGLFVGGLGLRWFLVEGPPLTASSAEAEPELRGDRRVELPVNVRLVDARNRLRAHILRFVALGSGGLLIAFDLGIFKWAVISLFLLSFVADHVLLRPKRYVLDADGLRSDGPLGGRPVSWPSVQALYWRHYPGKERAPFPSGERVIVEGEEGDDDVEFVFQKKYGGTEASFFMRAALPVLGDKVRVLTPRSAPRIAVDSRSVVDMLDAGQETPGEKATQPTSEAAADGPAGE